MYRNFLVTAASVIAMVSAANAADTYAAGGYKDGPAYAGVNWSGFYAGINGGYGWNANDQSLTETDYKGSSIAVGQFAAPQNDGGFGGGQIGYNWQGILFGPHAVFGLEADIQGAGISGKNNLATTASYNDTVSGNRNLDWFGTVRGRLGYALGGTLFYATGGFAYGGVRNHIVTTSNSTANNYASFGSSSTGTGYVVGGGIEHQLTPAWSVKAEYQFIDLGSEAYTGTYIATGHYATLSDLDEQYHTFRLGLNYRFGSDFGPLK